MKKYILIFVFLILGVSVFAAISESETDVQAAPVHTLSEFINPDDGTVIPVEPPSKTPPIKIVDDRLKWIIGGSVLAGVAVFFVGYLIFRKYWTKKYPKKYLSEKPKFGKDEK